MGIKIEIDTDQCDALGWRALAAFVAVMQSPSVPGSIAVHTAVGSDEELKELRPTSARRYEGTPPSHSDTLIVPLPHLTNVERLERQAAAFPSHSPLHPADNPATGAPTEEETALAEFAASIVPNVPTAPSAPTAAAPVAPPAPGVPPVPGVPASVPASGTSAVLDTKGLPWDARIHSSSRGKVADGSWKAKRKVDAAVVAAVEAELRAVQGLPAPAPVRTASSPPPPPPGAVEVMTFIKLVPKITQAIKMGMLTQARVNELLLSHGLPHLPALHARPDFVTPIHDALFGGAA
jgi:hypothetical protein